MSDLISRSELLEEIKSLSIVLNGKQIFPDDAKDTILRIINEQPTSYSVDEVVAELEKLKMRYFLTIANTGDEKSDFAYENVGNALDEAIEIVKHGGIGKVVEQMDEEDFFYCHHDDTDEYHDCLDYMECEECPYYYADLDQESD